MTKLCTKCSKHLVKQQSNNTWCKSCKSEDAKKRHKKCYIPKPLKLTTICIDCSIPRTKTISWVGEHCRNCYETLLRKNPTVKAKVNKRNAKYRKNNKDKRNLYENNRFKTNPSARLANRFRNWVNKLIKNKSGNAESLIGCSYNELKIYIESKWKPGMTWDNWSNEGWQIDHIEPLLSFDLTDPKQQKDAFCCANLQPLWKKEHELKTMEDLRKHRQ
jgi:hypothetical protein